MRKQKLIRILAAGKLFLSKEIGAYAGRLSSIDILLRVTLDISWSVSPVVFTDLEGKKLQIPIQIPLRYYPSPLYFGIMYFLNMFSIFCYMHNLFSICR